MRGDNRTPRQQPAAPPSNLEEVGHEPRLPSLARAVTADSCREETGSTRSSRSSVSTIISETSFCHNLEAPISLVLVEAQLQTAG